jgi:hypothetical protein
MTHTPLEVGCVPRALLLRQAFSLRVP